MKSLREKHAQKQTSDGTITRTVSTYDDWGMEDVIFSPHLCPDKVVRILKDEDLHVLSTQKINKHTFNYVVKGSYLTKCEVCARFYAAVAKVSSINLAIERIFEEEGI